MTPHSSDGLGLLFSPASAYPTPTAYLIDRDGAILHTWSHPHGQLDSADNPPSYLRGWNHIETDPACNLLAIVPLRALLKLTPDSQLEWSCDIAAHHDLAITGDGTILVLTEAPRRVENRQHGQVVLDNLITTVTAEGVVKTDLSLWDTLRTDQSLRGKIDAVAGRRNAALRLRGWPGRDDTVDDTTVTETLALLQTGCYDGEPRRALQLLRALPGSPCDILHTNTLEILPANPDGIWDHGDVLICVRELDTIAVIGLADAAVKWWWGPGQLSGPHQPTLLPDGQILVFDNGRTSQRTRLLAIDPATKRVTWSWTADPPESFFCPLAGGCQPLPNGNLLVTNSTAGAAFELTRDGRVVWDVSLPVGVYGAERGRVSIYRMSAVPAADVLAARSQQRGSWEVVS
ncbi:arylsulfotransferase family protein [Catellatospora sp. NPDC049111]|uniref:arylsulfotransferase family protein n=1 Tax=Catellatospora sp. NPDC049111 TaxID=3155271 RepID=UPI0033ED7DFC